MTEPTSFKPAHALEPVPVFNCVVHVTRPDPNGLVTARVVNLAGIEASGKSEREALTQVVTAFKAAVAEFHTRGEPIPFTAPHPQLAAGELERLIAVHL